MADNEGKQIIPHAVPVEDIFSEYETDESGLTDEQAAEKLKKYGTNTIEGKKQKSLLRLFIDQINNPIIFLLIVAVIISFIFKDIPEAIAIIVVIILNTVIGFWMEYQARTSVKALKKLNRLKTRVKRDNNIIEIDDSRIVPGDVIVLEAGDVVPADAKIISYAELKVDESPLTGESLPVEKKTGRKKEDAILARRTNMLFKGTALTNGKAEAIVTSTGIRTEIGKISEMVEEEDKESIPLNIKLRKLSHNLIWVTGSLAVVFFLIGWFSGKELYLMLQTAIAWTVAAIPEGLPIVASIALARGMLKLAKRNVIVKKLSAVETLGETTVIFTDKTGTLTENKLTLQTIESPGNIYETKKLISDNKKEDDAKQLSDDENFRHIFRVSVLANDAERDENSKYKGDPLDVSLLEFFNSFDENDTDELQEARLINENPFDSASKFMGAIHFLNDELYISCKGAAEPVLERCSHYMEKGEKKKINENIRNRWLSRNEKLSGKGLKVIACSYKTADKKEEDSLKEKEEFVSEMTFIGFVCFIDPAKEDVEKAIDKCKQAGIQIVMVTGDHPGTARNIAEQVQLAAPEDIKIMKGSEIEKDGKQVYRSNLFARVDPGQKYKIVERFKEEGEIVAMTGDGVNDAPALKKADIGIAMGTRGTEIAREVAEMVLKDDSFPSIVSAVKEGRIIFGNIRKFIIYQLSYHLAEIIIIAGISFSLFYLPLLPLQLLFLNLLSDVFPALALGLGKGDESIMREKPKDPEEPIINKRNWMSMAVYGIIMAIIICGAYLLTYYYFNQSKEVANTVAFFSLAISQLLHVFNMREWVENLFINQITKNKFIWLALGICFAALAASYFIPVLHEVLSFETLSGTYWLLVGITSLLTLIVIQAVKNIFKI